MLASPGSPDIRGSSRFATNAWVASRELWSQGSLATAPAEAAGLLPGRLVVRRRRRRPTWPSGQSRASARARGSPGPGDAGDQAAAQPNAVGGVARPRRGGDRPVHDRAHDGRALAGGRGRSSRSARAPSGTPGRRESRRRGAAPRSPRPAAPASCRHGAAPPRARRARLPAGRRADSGRDAGTTVGCADPIRRLRRPTRPRTSIRVRPWPTSRTRSTTRSAARWRRRSSTSRSPSTTTPRRCRSWPRTSTARRSRSGTTR